MNTSITVIEVDSVSAKGKIANVGFWQIKYLRLFMTVWLSIFPITFG